VACHEAGIAALVPKTKTSNAKFDGDSTRPTSSTTQRKTITLSGRPSADLAFFNRRERYDESLILELELQRLCAQGQVHAEPGTPRNPMGASRPARQHAGAPG
jgi:antitoxin (DNA-binding transcriptional repressor) of toxin-antitoxin stability system